MKLLMLQQQAFNPGETFLPAAEKIISGRPEQQVWPHYSNRNQAFQTGIWQSDIGKWKVSYTEDEYCHILEGVSVVTDAYGTSTVLKVGDQFVIPAGFDGTWEVVEPTKKIYVVYEESQGD